MNCNHEAFSNALEHALSGEGAHVKTESVFDGLDWEAAGFEHPGFSHSIFQLLFHISFWQDWGLQWLDGEHPTVPRHASGSWPKQNRPASEADWKRAVSSFRRGLHELQTRSRKLDLSERIGKKTRAQMLHTVASHNSYHIGQVVALRQILGNWPPPSGGLTW